MIETVSDLSPAARARFDAIIDVRSPAEYEDDAIPGAINLPVLSNAERAEVGTIYVRESRFRARRVGAALVARNIARHLDTALADAPAKFRPLLYCWRGGMRSGAMASVLSQIGWRVGVVEGGYRTWRRAVVGALRVSRAPLDVILLDGQTGAGKSAALSRLAALGAQTIDLETLAAHRGSVFGAAPGGVQPSQKRFESSLYDALSRLDSARPVFIEAESAKIGRLQIPSALWRAMQAARRIELRCAPEIRAAYLAETYRDVIDSGRIDAAISRLAPFHAKPLIAAWRALAAAEQYAPLAEHLVRAHYDPLYERARARRGDAPLAVIALNSLDDDAVAAAAARIHALA